MQLPCRSNSRVSRQTAGGPDPAHGGVGSNHEIRPDLYSTSKWEAQLVMSPFPRSVMRANWSTSVRYSDPFDPYAVAVALIKRWPSKHSLSRESYWTVRFAPSWVSVLGQR